MRIENSRKEIKWTCIFLCLAITVLTIPVNAQEGKPNIIVILADDLAYADIEGYGANYRTPHLKKMQREGMKFTSFYAQPQCSPSRAALLTGCYPQRVGIPWVVGPKGPAWMADKHMVGLNPEEETVAELLKQQNYATACIGKWHLGDHAQHLPKRHGFDEYWGLPYSNDMRPESRIEWPDLPLINGDEIVAINPNQRLLTKQYTEKAIDFIMRNRSRPFFLYLAHSMPHVPLFVSDAFKNESGKGLYADVIREIDWSVGEVMDALKKYNIDQNTVVIFTSDNGPWLTYGNHAGNAGLFREGKATTFEGGVRVPMIVRWPAKVKKNSVSDNIAGLIDLLPTIVEITSTTMPKKKIDGKSFLPTLMQQEMTARDTHYYFQIHELQAVRKGKWKLHFPHKYVHTGRAGIDGERGVSEERSIELSLFDLSNDPGELNNVAEKYPEVVGELSRLAQTFSAEIKAERRDPGIAP